MNDLIKIEGIRDILTDQIYEHVFHYMREHEMFHEDNPFLERVRNFLERVEQLPSLYINNELSNEINDLYQELNELLVIVHYKNVH
ncbi:MAG: hypothetical protein LUG46_04770 [Erysipelotrichaceae bacterium]|nr:hypothetical protein [Erysipelotrichaceae bacterium]